MNLQNDFCENDLAKTKSMLKNSWANRRLLKHDIGET